MVASTNIKLSEYNIQSELKFVGSCCLDTAIYTYTCKDANTYVLLIHFSLFSPQGEYCPLMLENWLKSELGTNNT